MKMSQGERIKRGNAGQFRVASELCRRGYSAAITLGNTPNVDILCSSDDGSKSICIQVKTFRLGAHKCPLTIAAERISREDFFWVFLGLDDQLSPKLSVPLNFMFFLLASWLRKCLKGIVHGWLKSQGVERCT